MSAVLTGDPLPGFGKPGGTRRIELVSPQRRLDCVEAGLLGGMPDRIDKHPLPHAAVELVDEMARADLGIDLAGQPDQGGVDEAAEGPGSRGVG